MKTIFSATLGLFIYSAIASAGTISYVCDPNVSTSVCSYLNTTVANMYSDTFTNANAVIYIEYGSTGLAATGSVTNYESYSNYVTALTDNANQSAVQVAALAALSSYDTAPYGTGNVGLSTALASALGFTGLYGVTAGGGSACNFGNMNCYDASITVTNDVNTPLYYDTGGAQASDAYDFYSAVEHETDEVLGTASCVSTTNGGVLTNGCGGSTPSAVDLFRYNSAGSLALNSSYIGSSGAPSGAYFSYNGGSTNGAVGVGGTSKYYNTSANGEDYADFVSSSPCQTNQAIQDAEGCPGQGAGLSILNDGGGEINILNAVGYDLVNPAPEPGTIVLFGAGLAALYGFRRRIRG